MPTHRPATYPGEKPSAKTVASVEVDPLDPTTSDPVDASGGGYAGATGGSSAEVFEVTNLLIPAGTDWTSAANEQQALHIDPVASSGTYTLSFGGQTTTGIAFDADGATVQAALEALSTIGSGNMHVDGALPDLYPTFIGALAGANRPLIVFNGAGLDNAGTSGITANIEGKADTRHQLGEFTVEALAGYVNHLAFTVDPPDPSQYVGIAWVIPDPVVDFLTCNTSASDNGTYGIHQGQGSVIEDFNSLNIDTPEATYTMRAVVVAAAPPSDVTMVRARASFLVV
jgi:hypothetical protein